MKHASQINPALPLIRYETSHVMNCNANVIKTCDDILMIDLIKFPVISVQMSSAFKVQSRGCFYL